MLVVVVLVGYLSSLLAVKSRTQRPRFAWDSCSCRCCSEAANLCDDPIDVVEIGGSALDMGSVKEVKPLSVMAMIDDGELDWKVVAVAVDNPLAEEYNDIDDVPAAIKDGIREWFRWYKTPDNKPLNSFGFDEKFLDVAFTKEVIEETNAAWKKLKEDGSEKLWLN